MTESTVEKRIVYVEDALTWLEARPQIPKASVFASLPDRSEFPLFSIEEWESWFISAASKTLVSCPDGGISIFLQSDIKVDGVWIGKGFLIEKAAEAEGIPLRWHKIILRVPVGRGTFGRPSYSHLLCFS